MALEAGTTVAAATTVATAAEAGTLATIWGAITASAWSILFTLSVFAVIVAATAYGTYAYTKSSRAEAPALAHVQDLSEIA